MNKMETTKGQLIVSCQALPNEPLHSSFIMGRMAKAAKEGGAKGIRANTVVDIKEIKEQVDLPVIGIIKREVIAVDATCRTRPDGKTLDEFVSEIRAKYPDQLLMADCSTLEEMLHADEIGFDFIGTTLVGYTEQSKGNKIEANDFEIIRSLLEKAKHPVIAEGNIDTPEKVRRVLDLGCYSVVVGSIITRPQVITKRFVDAIK